MKPDFAISVQGLCKQFGNRMVVDGVNLEVPAGSVYGFLGPNGSGKTTCIRIICGLLEPSAGSGYCLGFDIMRERDRIKREVGYMTQRFSLYEDLTVEENLRFVARIYRLDKPKQAIAETIEQFGLGDKYRQLAGTLSGGWKQRLSLAAAMLHHPRLLLLDEPTAGVDPKARRDFWREIHSLSLQGLTVLVTTHYMDEAEQCSDLAYIVKGKILIRGAPTAMVAESKLITFVVTGDDLFALADKLSAISEIEQIAAFGSKLHVSGSSEAEVQAILKSTCTADQSYRKIETSLEDVFIHLME